jgi:hypothetical protein
MTERISLFQKDTQQFTPLLSSKKSKEDPKQRLDQRRREEKKGYSIDTFYSINELLNYLDRMNQEGSTEEARIHYAVKDVETMCLEYAFETPYSFLRYHVEPEGVYYLGQTTPVSSTFRREAERVSKQNYSELATLSLNEIQGMHRHVVDAVAWDRSLRDLFYGDSNIAIQISPPTHGAEGFSDGVIINCYIKNGKNIETHYFLMPGETKDFRLSQEIEQKIKTILTHYTHDVKQSNEQLHIDEKRFLLQPVTAKVAHDFDITAFAEAIGLDTSGMVKANQYMNAMRTDDVFQSAMNEYITIATKNSKSRLTTNDHTYLRKLFLTMFNRSRELKKVVDNKQEVHMEQIVDIPFYSRVNRNSKGKDNLCMLVQMYGYEALVQGGSCPLSVSRGIDTIMNTFGGRLNYDSGIALSNFMANKVSAFTELLPNSEKYVFDKEGSCNKCKKLHTEVGKLGPCYVCKGCQKEFDQQEFIEKLLGKSINNRYV